MDRLFNPMTLMDQLQQDNSIIVKTEEYPTDQLMHFIDHKILEIVDSRQSLQGSLFYHQKLNYTTDVW